MIDHTDDGLRAAIKALDEVVAPAIDTANPLAVEQLRLVSRFLGFLRSRIPYEHARARHELHHYLGLAQTLVTLAPNDAPVRSRDAIGAAIHSATPVLHEASASAQQIQSAIASLSSATSALVREVAVASPAVRAPIERAVVLAAQQLLDAQRAWFLPMGFEPDPRCVPSINEALRTTH
jgi:hypothetical protein